ncbi:MAG: HEAT repeat domain-containing protein [Verrucomicrobia bacterium]|nr:HEAT repeat domain-containing protein [Verrucomicrobiota bacterium]
MPARASVHFLFAGAATVVLNAFAQTPPPAVIQVPAGFEVVRVAVPPRVGFPMLGGFDQRGRLFVAKNAGLTLSRDALEAQTPSRIRVLEDIDGDGVFDRSAVFADRLTFPQGVQWHDGALYVASPPSVWRLADADGSLLVIDTGEWYRRCPTSGFQQAEAPGGIHRVRRALGDTDIRIRQAACQSVFTTAERDAFDQLMPLLRDESLAVRREAARALGRLRNPAAIPALADAAAATKHDPVLTHALIYALIEIDHPAETRKLLAHLHPRTRRAGLIVLDQILPENVPARSTFEALRSPDAGLQSAACSIAVKRPAWGGEARDPARPTAFRVAALQAAAGGDHGLDEDSFQMLMEPYVTGGSLEARLQAASVLASAKLNRARIRKRGAADGGNIKPGGGERQPRDRAGEDRGERRSDPRSHGVRLRRWGLHQLSSRRQHRRDDGAGSFPDREDSQRSRLDRGDCLSQRHHRPGDMSRSAFKSTAGKRSWAPFRGKPPIRSWSPPATVASWPSPVLRSPGSNPSEHLSCRWAWIGRSTREPWRTLSPSCNASSNPAVPAR